MIRYLKLDETIYWREDIQQKAGKIFSVYIYDDGSVTHCCELTPSYELNFVHSQPSNADDETYDNILYGDADSEPVTYMHCSTVDRLKSFPLEMFDSVEEAVEYARCNWL